MLKMEIAFAGFGLCSVQTRNCLFSKWLEMIPGFYIFQKDLAIARVTFFGSVDPDNILVQSLAEILNSRDRPTPP